MNGHYKNERKKNPIKKIKIKKGRNERKKERMNE